MTAKGMCWMLAAMLLGTCCAAQGQSAQEPLPPSSAPKPLVLPKTSGPIQLYSTRPGDVPPPAPLPDDAETFCTTPSDNSYRTEKPVSAEGKKAAELYIWSVKKEIWGNWKTPREINDPWLKSAMVRIKFEILADGSLNDPVIMMSSGRASYDRSALASIKHSAPFRPPPANGPTPFRICYSFGYNTNREYQETMPVDIFAKKPAQP